MNEENDNSAAWIAAAGPVATATINAADSRAGRKWQEEQIAADREWQESMYQRQLDDSIAWRNEERAYNSIGAQLSRYRDAGINPMYAVTGKGADQVVQPFSASSGGFRSSSPHPYGKQYSLDFSQAIALQNQTKVANAQAADYQASAQLKLSQAYEQEFTNKVYEILNNTWDMNLSAQQKRTFHEMRADVMFSALKYQEQFQGLEFNEAKQVFEHLPIVREFEKSLQAHERKLWVHELRQAESASSVAEVTAQFATLKNIIGIGSEVLGAAAAVFAATKGSKYNPGVSHSTVSSNSFSESYNHSYRHYEK